MSLTAKQMEQTRLELRKNFEISGLTAREITDSLGLPAGEFERTLNLERGVNPTTVWRLRDYLEMQIAASGKTGYPYTALIENIYYPYGALHAVTKT